MIYVECDADEALVKALDIPKKEIEHRSGKASICKKLEKGSNSKGLVDEDPSAAQPTYIKKAKLQLNRHDIKVLYDDNAKNYIIMLCPRLEGWVLKAAKQAGVKMESYNLPNTEAELHSIINTKIGKFINLVQNIKNNKKSKMLKALQESLKIK